MQGAGPSLVEEHRQGGVTLQGKSRESVFPPHSTHSHSCQGPAVPEPSWELECARACDCSPSPWVSQEGAGWRWVESGSGGVSRGQQMSTLQPKLHGLPFSTLHLCALTSGLLPMLLPLPGMPSPPQSG